MKSIIGICGFGYSGSGALLDFLKDYKDICVKDELEFSMVYTPDGIEDLYRAISLYPSRYWSSDSSIRRFIQLANWRKKSYDKLTNGQYSDLLASYLDRIIQTSWIGSTSVHVYQDSNVEYFFFQKLLRQLIVRWESNFGKIPFRTKPQKKMYYSSLKESEFVKISRQFITYIIESLSLTSDTIVLDQPFAANFPEKSFPFFENPKAILVTRDPRDTYILAKQHLGLTGTFIPTDNVDAFICYYKGLMDSVHIDNKQKVMIIPFEDLVYKYEETKLKIENFVGCKVLRDNIESKKFNPNISINNTQLFLKHPQYEDDVCKIEHYLSQYVYNYCCPIKIGID